MCLPLLIFPCTIKSRSSLLASAHPGGPGNRAVKRICVCVCVCRFLKSLEVDQERFSLVGGQGFEFPSVPQRC